MNDSSAKILASAVRATATTYYHTQNHPHDPHPPAARRYQVVAQQGDLDKIVAAFPTEREAWEDAARRRAVLVSDVVSDQLASAEEACEAACRYDDAIAKRAETGDVELIDGGGSIARGADLDALYCDWMHKARAVIARRDAT